jgi:antirestriction protein ArdC
MGNQKNHLTKNCYGGRNQVELTRAKNANGFNSDEWVTFLQARQNGLKIKKGSHGFSIFKGFGRIDQKTTKDGKIKINSVSVPIGFARVFNLDQTEAMTK